MNTQKTILVVEDEDLIRKTYVDELTDAGFNVLGAANGKEGVDLALSKHPDFILLDLIMPEMDGMSALKKIREDAWGAHVPVLILTNLSATNEQLVDDMVTHQPTDYLIKSDWKLSEVVGKIQKVLGR